MRLAATHSTVSAVSQQSADRTQAWWDRYRSIVEFYVLPQRPDGMTAAVAAGLAFPQ